MSTLDPSPLELRHLRAFVAVAEAEHVTRAAQRLHIAQPALSRQIRQLEAIVGADLFARVGRGIRLTDAGRAFLDDARAVLGAVASAATRAREVANGRAGVLRVGFVEVASASGLVAEAVRRFSAARPGVAVDLREMSSSLQLAALDAGELDVGMVCRLSAERAGISRATTLLADPLVAVLPLGHPLAKTRRVTLASLAGERLLMVRRQVIPGMTAELETAFAREGLAMPEVQEVSQMQTAVHLAAAGIGIGVIPRAVAATSAGIELRPIAGVTILHTTQLIVGEHHRASAAESFTSICEQVGRELDVAPGTAGAAARRPRVGRRRRAARTRR